MGTIYIDSDGFFWPSDISNEYMHDQRKGISFEKNNQPVSVLFEQYYLGFRSSMLICEDELNKEDGMKLLKEWRESCVKMAIDYTNKHLSSEESLPVDFLWIMKMSIVNLLKYEYPDAEKIPLVLTMKPLTSAYAKNRNTIVFPALVRSLLNHCNLVLLNQAYYVLDNKENKIDRRYLSRFILPYLIFCHDDISVMHLPIIGGYSDDVITTAFNFTNLQVMFILAHEYAHILLNHFDTDNESKTNEMKENQADAFALKVVLQLVENEDTSAKTNVFTAIRWLFKFQLLEETIGRLVRGDVLNGSISQYEERRSSFQKELIFNYKLTKTSLVDAIGFAAIVELQGVLSEYGVKLTNTIIQAFHDSKNKGEIEPWWEMITQK